VLLATRETLASILLAEKHFAEAEALYRQIVDSDRRALGPEHFDTLLSMQGLGNTLMEEGKYTEAERVYREVLGVQERVLGTDHPTTAMTRYDLGCVTAHEKHKTEAISILSEAVDHGLPGFGDLALEKDPDLNSLHGDPRFAALVAHAKEMAAQQKKPAGSATTSSQKAN
jgi:tetratricopeptide (TPR) repeat protein